MPILEGEVVRKFESKAKKTPCVTIEYKEKDRAGTQKTTLSVPDFSIYEIGKTYKFNAVVNFAFVNR